MAVKFTVCLILGLAAMLGACSGTSNLDREREAILAADRAWAVLPYWTDDSTILFMNGDVVSGKTAIRDYVTKRRSHPGSLTWTPESAEVSESADLGYSRGTYHLEAPGPQGQLVRREGSYVSIWRKQPDGTWKCELEISNMKLPPPPAAPAP